MARVSVLGAVVLLAIQLPLSAGQKDKQKDPEKPAGHVLLRVELMEEQQNLQRLQIEWMLQVVRMKQRLDKTGTDASRQEVAACARMLDAARELPALFDGAVGRLKQSSLANIALTKEALKATGQLADELTRVSDLLHKAAQEGFATERALGLKEIELGFALFEVADALARAGRLLEGIENAADPTAPVRSARQALQGSKETCLVAHAAYRTLVQEAKDKQQASAQAAFAERIARPLSGLLDQKGLFVRVDVAVVALGDTNVVSPAAATKARAELAELRAAFEPMYEPVIRLVVVGGVHALAQRQQRLHARLKQHHDDAVAKLLESLDKLPN